MKYTKGQRLDIGRRIYDGELSRYGTAEEYGINNQTARNHMRMYRDGNQLPPKHGQRSIGAPSFKKAPADLNELETMTKEGLIQELVKAKIIEARLKKGYEVQGDGTVTSLPNHGYPAKQFLCMEETSFPAVGKRTAPCRQCPAVSGVPLEISVARLPLVERQNTSGQGHCSVRSLCP